MQKLMKVLEDMMVAITFAEAGEYDEAKKLALQDQNDEAFLTEHLKAKQA